MASAQPFRIGIIGAGGIAGAHTGAAQAAGDAIKVVAVADPSNAARQRVVDQTGATGFETAEALIKAAKTLGLDGVVVCTPPSVRAAIVRKAVAAGLHVLSEKPIAHTLPEAKKIAAIGAAARKVVTAVGYCHRFTPAVNEMKRLIAAGKIGRVVRFENAFACDLPGHQTKWFSDPRKSGGGAYLDMGSHSIDLFNYMIGPSETVAAVFDKKWPRRAETAATVMLRSTKKGGANIKPGVPGVILSGWAETSRFTVAVVGDAGMLFYDYEKPTELVFKDLLGKAEVMPIQSHEVRFQLQLEAFAAAARAKGKGKSQLATFADGLAAAEQNAAAAKLAS